MSTVFFAVEDELSGVVTERLLRGAFGETCETSRLLKSRAGGFGQLKANVPKYLNLARSKPVAVLTDLDRWDCPVALISDWFGRRSVPDGLAFRVAVREIETWLLADRDGMSEFLGISAARIPRDLDSLVDPKEALISLARGAKRELRVEIVPHERSKAKQGLGYNDVFSRFVREKWNAAEAASSSASLRRALVSFEKLKSYWEGRS